MGAVQLVVAACTHVSATQDIKEARFTVGKTSISQQLSGEQTGRQNTAYTTKCITECVQGVAVV
jgi:hypothetical protein